MSNINIGEKLYKIKVEALDTLKITIASHEIVSIIQRAYETEILTEEKGNTHRNNVDRIGEIFFKTRKECLANLIKLAADELMHCKEEEK